MAKFLIVGADVHEEYVMTKWCVDQGEASKSSFRMTESGQSKMIAMLHNTARTAGVKEIVFAYEACCMGFGLYDRLTDASITCHVLAPTRIEKSNKQRRSKCDEKDAQQILEILKGHLLAGNSLPDVWIPDHQTRQDRTVVRRRLELTKKSTRVKAQIRMTLKKADVKRPKDLSKGWTKAFRQWLRDICDLEEGVLQYGEILALESYLRELRFLEDEIQLQDHNVEVLSRDERYLEACQALCEMKGVSTLTAMVFLTEVGDMSRFSNRRQIAAYFGLSPSSYETGENSDRKGHITKQGSERVRKVLCQAAWCRSSDDAAYARVLARNQKKKKVALVALMRRTAIKMWHIARDAQQQNGSFAELSRAET